MSEDQFKQLKELAGAATPGPWAVFNGVDVYPEAGSEDGSNYIAHCDPDGSDRTMTWEEAKANARLIAASPDLLTALLDTLQNGIIYWEPQTMRGAEAKDKMIKRAQEALKKAGVTI